MDVSDAEYALHLVKTICAEVGPGLPGSLQERERAAAIGKELGAHVGSGNVSTEEFTLAPNAFLSPFYLGGFFTLLAAVLNVSTGRIAGVSPWITVILAVVLSIAPLLLFVAEFLYSFEFIDPLFGKKQSVNVIGTLRRPGTEDVKRLLILSGHHDSAWENVWLRLPGYGFFVATATWLGGLLTMLSMALIQLTGVVTGQAAIVQAGTLGWVLLAFPVVPSIVLSLPYNMRSKNNGNVPGAADNLSACAVVVAACRFLARNPQQIPVGTEIRFVTFGSEEAGLRGSKRYVERHTDELKRMDARILNLEIIAHPEVDILTSEVNGSVRNSPEMVKGVISAAERAGVPCRAKSASLGVSSDAGSFSRAGIKATTMLCFKVPQQMLGFYHQRWDTPEVLSAEPLLNALKTSTEWIRGGG